MNKIGNLSPYFKRPYNGLYGGGGGIIPLAGIIDLSATESGGTVSLTWTDPNDIVKGGKTITAWTSTKIVRKEGSAPTDSTDGDLILTETTKNQYSSSGYTDSSIPASGTYYYVAFAVADNGLETISNIEEVEVVVSLYKTYTIVRQEVADPAQFFVRYEDDAVGMTQGSSDFDTFFGYSGVRLSSSGVETGTVDLTNMSSETGLTSGDNVMVKFPIRGIKMSKSGNQVSLSITDDPNAESKGFQYYAHSRGTFESPVKKTAFYIGAYEGSLINSVLKSLSGALVASRVKMPNSINSARANDNNDGTAGYDIVGFYQRMYINALYMMKYGNPDSQGVIGQGIVSGSRQNSGGSNSISGTTGGDIAGSTTAMKLFGIENWWGNIAEWIGGLCTDGSKNIYTALSGFVGDVKTTPPYENTGTTVSLTYQGTISNIVGNNRALFTPTGFGDTYYSDVCAIEASKIGIAGGYYSNGAGAGAFYFYMTYSASNGYAQHGVRLMFL